MHFWTSKEMHIFWTGNSERRETNNVVLFHVFLYSLLDALETEAAGWWTKDPLFDGAKIDKLKWIAFLVESNLLLMGQRGVRDGQYSYTTWNLRKRRLNGSAALRAFWNKTWTVSLSKKVARYCHSMEQIIKLWFTAGKIITTLSSLRCFLKYARQLHFLVTSTMQLKYNLRRDCILRTETCGCEICVEILGPRPHTLWMM